MTNTATYRNNSWLIFHKETGQVIMETFDQSLVERVDKDTYDVVSIFDWLDQVKEKNKHKKNNPKC